MYAEQYPNAFHFKYVKTNLNKNIVEKIKSFSFIGILVIGIQEFLLDKNSLDL